MSEVRCSVSVGTNEHAGTDHASHETQRTHPDANFGLFTYKFYFESISYLSACLKAVCHVAKLILFLK